MDCRKADRIPFRLPIRATIYPPAGRETDTAKYTHILTQDLSGIGVSVIFSRPLCIGQRLDLEMPDRIRTVVVIRIAQMSDGRYLIGCQFDDVEAATPS